MLRSADELVCYKNGVAMLMCKCDAELYVPVSVVRSAKDFVGRCEEGCRQHVGMALSWIASGRIDGIGMTEVVVSTWGGIAMISAVW